MVAKAKGPRLTTICSLSDRHSALLLTPRRRSSRSVGLLCPLHGYQSRAYRTYLPIALVVTLKDAPSSNVRLAG